MYIADMISALFSYPMIFKLKLYGMSNNLPAKVDYIAA